MSEERFDVGIIGGGVIGLSCAWRLAQNGARVALFERGEIGREASWAAAGMLAAQCEAAHHPPSDDESSTRSRAAMFDLCLQSRAMYADFADEIGDDVELDLSGARSATYFRGITYVATRKDDIAIAAFEKQNADGLPVVALNAVYPPDIHFVRAFLLPDEGSVNNRKLVQYLKIAALRHQAAICENVEVRNVQTDNFWAKINTSAGTFRCEKVLMCAGSWSGYVPTPLAQILKHVQPIGGQMIALKYSLGQVLYSSDVYLVPRRDGSLLVGATVEAPGFRRESRNRATVAGTLQLLNAACQLLPDLKNAPFLDSWAGLRPGTPDGLPILGSTSVKNFYVATGHYRNGILLAPITAKLMTDCLLNDIEPPREFSIERFQNTA